MVTKRSNIKRENNCDEISCALRVTICLIDGVLSSQAIEKINSIF